MAIFSYDALNASGQKVSGQLEASDRSEVLRKLGRMGLQASNIRHSDPQPKNSPANSESLTKETSHLPLKLSRNQVIQFTEELCDLLGAGLQLEQALHAMESRSANLLRELSARARSRVREGIPFSIALSQVCPSFGELYCNLVAAGEASGSLSSILNRQARYLNQMEALQAKVTSALIYPLFIVVSGIALAVVFISYLLPKLAALVKNTHGELPMIAQFLLGLSAFLKDWWWVIILVFVTAALGLKILFKTPEKKLWWHRIQLKLPVFGSIFQTRFEVQFLETLGNLLQNGLPLHRGLELVRRATPNLFLKDRLKTLETLVADGGSLSRALEKTEIARPLMIDMVRVGEQTGDLAEALQKAASRFDRQLSKTMENATALIQPVIVVCMAFMVGSMAWMMINVVYGTLDHMRNR